MARALNGPPAELLELECILARAAPRFRVRSVPGAAAKGSGALPVHVIALGSDDVHAPAVAFVAGVHGLERIGTHVVLAWLRAIVDRLEWDVSLHAQLETLRLLFLPIVNPGGMQRGTRANPAGVDLMRNAPVDAMDPVPPLIGGHRIGSGLPWYRGIAGEPMQPESSALCAAIEEELLSRPVSIALDCHSGFGMRDRLWFPFAGRRAPFPFLAHLHALRSIFESSHDSHPYVFEPQSRQYLAHGDLWDYLVLRTPPDHVFLPLTLEMGSWLWVKKNPRQLLSPAGLFNPVLAHRHQRVLRRHLPLFEFLLRAAASHERWMPRAPQDLEEHRQRALGLWYGPGMTS